MHEIHQNIRIILNESLAGMKEMELRVALQRTFGSVDKGYGALVAVRNTLNSLTKKGE